MRVYNNKNQNQSAAKPKYQNKSQPKFKPKTPAKDPYFLFKVLTKCLIDPTEERLNKLTENKTEAEKFKNRAILQIQAYPHLIHKINKYLNDYNVAQQFTPRQWIEFLAQLLKMQNINNSNGFYFQKFHLNDYVEFSKKIKNYYKQIDADDPSSQEIQALYVLYNNELITDDDLDDLIIQNDEKPKSTKTTKVVNQTLLNFNMTSGKDFISSKTRTFDTLPDFVKTYTQNCLAFIKSRKTCYQCELNKNRKIILDSNIENESESVDVLFVGYHPTDADCQAMLPMSSQNFTLFRDMLDTMLIKYPHIKFACMNILSCCANEEVNLSKPELAITKCKEIATVIRENLKPKIIMTFGDKAMKWFGIKGSVTKNNGTLINNVIPTVAPESLQYNAKNKTLFETAWVELFSTIDSATVKQKAEIGGDCEYNIPQSAIVTKITPDLTILDIKELDNQLVFIFKDKDGRKKYYFENIKYQVFIKYGDYRTCRFVCDEMDEVVYLNSYQLSQLNKKIYADMQALTRKE